MPFINRQGRNPNKRNLNKHSLNKRRDYVLDSNRSFLAWRKNERK